MFDRLEMPHIGVITFKGGKVYVTKILKEIGIILHQAKSGRLIVKLSAAVPAGSFLVDDKGRRLGRVTELIGPVRAPYASVALVTSRIGSSGDSAYIAG